MEHIKDDQAGGAQVVRRVSELMRCVSACNRSGARLADLCSETGISRSTAHRLLQALVSESLLRQDSKSKRYHVGSRVYEMGLSAVPRKDIRTICLPFLETLAIITGNIVMLTIRADLDALCVARAETSPIVRVYVMDIGVRRPLTIANGGLAILSCLADNEIDRLFVSNRERILRTSVEHDERILRNIVERAKASGFVLANAVEAPSLRTLAMPIRAPDGSSRAAISISGPASSMVEPGVGLIRNKLATSIQRIEALIARD